MSYNPIGYLKGEAELLRTTLEEYATIVVDYSDEALIVLTALTALGVVSTGVVKLRELIIKDLEKTFSEGNDINNAGNLSGYNDLYINNVNSSKPLIEE